MGPRVRVFEIRDTGRVAETLASVPVWTKAASEIERFCGWQPGPIPKLTGSRVQIPPLPTLLDIDLHPTKGGPCAMPCKETTKKAAPAKKSPAKKTPAKKKAAPAKGK